MLVDMRRSWRQTKTKLLRAWSLLRLAVSGSYAGQRSWKKRGRYLRRALPGGSLVLLWGGICAGTEPEPGDVVQRSTTRPVAARCPGEGPAKDLISSLPPLHRLVFPGIDQRIGGIALSSDGQWGVSGDLDGVLRWWRISDTSEVCRFGGHSSAILSVAISPDSRSLLSGSQSGVLQMWDPRHGQEVRRFAGHPSAVRQVAFASDGRQALSAHEDGEILRWDVDSGLSLGSAIRVKGGIRAAAFSSDGRVALVAAGPLLTLWDLESSQPIRRFRGHRGSITSVALSTDGRWALSGSRDGRIKVWRLTAGRAYREMRGAEPVGAIAFFPDARRALSGIMDMGDNIFGELHVWDVEEGQVAARLTSAPPEVIGDVTSIVISSDGRLALTSGGGLSVWKLP